MADRDDEFERLIGETGVSGQVDDFDSVAGELGVLPAEEPQPEASRGTGNSWLDSLIGGMEGVSLGRLRELGGVGALGHAGAGRMFDLHDQNAARALETPAGKAGKTAGTAATAIGLSALAGPGVGAQAATGAGLGAATASDASDDDWLATLTGGATGALLGGLGGALGQGLQSLRAPAAGGAGSVADEALSWLGRRAPGLGQAIMEPWRAAKNYAGQALIRGATKVPPAVPQAAGQLAAAGGGAAEGMIGRAQAQAPDVAYGTAPTMAWAVQSVLSSGSAGLEPADEQRLTEAVLSGDMDKLISANFALQQKSPAYAARMQRELESLQED